MLRDLPLIDSKLLFVRNFLIISHTAQARPVENKHNTVKRVKYNKLFYFRYFGGEAPKEAGSPESKQWRLLCWEEPNDVNIQYSPNYFKQIVNTEKICIKYSLSVNICLSIIVTKLCSNSFVTQKCSEWSGLPSSVLQVEQVISSPG